ncbi:hypothetical protein BZL41_05615 [Pseudomonas sp. PIC25]|uniref:hypothetical protein n=1 Tax=Pseudomonas sp. PIC25 TaxID=1958773 RepID=UPI000BAB545A|nr:hypothetical protein [Pseudomonas sp. PIC25]PAU65650.1 hypothetical protein BZL41_05615 [Pseudomonas sp. PIC25]
MTAHDPRLVGSWQKIDDAACAAKYAAHLRFEPTGLYFGSTEPAGGFTWWDGGTWATDVPGRLALSLANDEVVTYAYSLDDDTLIVDDPSGCRFRYRRAL